MSSKPGRKRGQLRGDYAEVRELAGVLRDIADSHGLTLRDLEERMPYARTSISQRLSGESRPEWKFVASLLAACTGGDRQAAAILERRVRPLWESAAPGRASRLAPAPPGGLPADVSTWVTAMRETAAAQQVVARLQMSASRSMSTVQGLMLLIEKLASAAQALAEERDALRLELLARSDTASELLRTRALLDDTQRRLEAAGLLLAQTSRRLDVAQRQREEADRLKDVAIKQVRANRHRLAEIEQHAIAFADSIRAEARPALIDARLMDTADQSLAAEILSRVDEALDAEASALDQLQGKLASASSDNGLLTGGQQPAVPAGLAVGSEAAAPTDPMVPGTTIRPASLSVIELRQAMGAGRLTSVALTRHCLSLIEALNPVLHAVISVSPDALKDAAASDQRWSSGQPRGSLEGIPVLVKDNIQVAGMPTTAGSPALAAAHMADAFIVSRLRAAGAVILAKTNMSEWANFRSYHSSHGWSTLGGQAANPYAPDRSPSGSSSGSAAGVSAGLAPLAVGTETDGSIVSPASMCGVVGIKPTLGLVSGSGIVPLSVVQDTAGPIAASVADAALLLSVLAADDPHDHNDAPQWARSQTDFTNFLDPQAIQGARIGIWRAAMKQADDKTLDVLDALVKQLRSLGAKVTDPVELPDTDKITGPEFAALEHEFKYSIDAYLGNLAASSASRIPGSLTELIDFNRRNAATILSRFGQDVFESANRRSGNPADPEYLELRRAAVQMAVKALQTPVEQHRLDAIVSLTANPASLIDYVLGDHSMFGTSRPAAVAGWPAISLPFGYVHGLPVGVTFTGPRWSEPRLIALAHAFEKATAARRPPILLQSVAPD